MTEENLASNDSEIFDNDSFLLGGGLTQSGLLTLGENLIANSLLGRVATSGNLVELDLGATDGSEKVVGILIYPIDATVANKNCQYYYSGEFNKSLVNWPASVDTDAEKEAVFDGSPIVLKTPE